jgi:RNA polymerase sigma factor (sigma-70 family)
MSRTRTARLRLAEDEDEHDRPETSPGELKTLRNGRPSFDASPRRAYIPPVALRQADPPARPADAGPSDRELVAAANRGDAAAMEALYRRHRSWVYSLALSFTGQAEDAADASQEVFFYLFQKFPGFELTCELRSFLYPAVRNIAMRIRQKRARVVPLADEAEPAARPDSPESESGDDRLAELVAGLPDELREVVVLRFGRDLALEEIAAELELPLGTVKSRLHRALAQLRDRLADRE